MWGEKLTSFFNSLVAMPRKVTSDLTDKSMPHSEILGLELEWNYWMELWAIPWDRVGEVNVFSIWEKERNWYLVTRRIVKKLKKYV